MKNRKLFYAVIVTVFVGLAVSSCSRNNFTSYGGGRGKKGCGCPTNVR